MYVDVDDAPLSLPGSPARSMRAVVAAALTLTIVAVFRPPPLLSPPLVRRGRGMMLALLLLLVVDDWMDVRVGWIGWDDEEEGRLLRLVRPSLQRRPHTPGRPTSLSVSHLWWRCGGVDSHNVSWLGRGSWLLLACSSLSVTRPPPSDLEMGRGRRPFQVVRPGPFQSKTRRAVNPCAAPIDHHASLGRRPLLGYPRGCIAWACACAVAACC